MKILFIIDSLNIGGREIVVINLANYFSKLGHIVSIIILDDSKLDCILKLDDTVLVFKTNIVSDSNVKCSYKNLSKTIKFIKEFKPDIIHHHTYAFRLLLMAVVIFLSRVKSKQIRTVHTSGLFYENRDGIFNKLRLISENLAIKLGKMKVVAISELIHKRNKYFFSKSSNSFYQIYNGIDLLSYGKNLDRVNDDTINYVYISRFVEGKNHDFLLKLWKYFSKDKNVHLYLAGDGPLETECKKISDEKLNKITFLGSIGNTSELLKNMDVALFPSSYEGFSLVLLEYFASSLPVIGSDIPAFSEIGKNEFNMLLVKDLNYDLYVKSMNDLYKSRRKREVLGSNAKNTVQEFDISIFYKKHYDLYLKCMYE